MYLGSTALAQLTSRLIWLGTNYSGEEALPPYLESPANPVADTRASGLRGARRTLNTALVESQNTAIWTSSTKRA
jgi:hypothetical protein